MAAEVVAKIVSIVADEDRDGYMVEFWVGQELEKNPTLNDAFRLLGHMDTLQRQVFAFYVEWEDDEYTMEPDEALGECLAIFDKYEQAEELGSPLDRQWKTGQVAEGLVTHLVHANVFGVWRTNQSGEDIETDASLRGGREVTSEAVTARPAPTAAEEDEYESDEDDDSDEEYEYEYESDDEDDKDDKDEGEGNDSAAAAEAQTDELEADETDEVEADETDELEADETDEVEADETDEVEADESDELEADESDELEADEADELEADEADELEADETDELEAEDESAADAEYEESDAGVEDGEASESDEAGEDETVRVRLIN